jgi:hypothetical protein
MIKKEIKLLILIGLVIFFNNLLAINFCRALLVSPEYSETRRNLSTKWFQRNLAALKLYDIAIDVSSRGQLIFQHSQQKLYTRLAPIKDIYSVYSESALYLLVARNVFEFEIIEIPLNGQSLKLINLQQAPNELLEAAMFQGIYGNPIIAKVKIEKVEPLSPEVSQLTVNWKIFDGYTNKLETITNTLGVRNEKIESQLKLNPEDLVGTTRIVINPDSGYITKQLLMP